MSRYSAIAVVVLCTAKISLYEQLERFGEGITSIE